MRWSCAWCGAESEADDGSQTTHGICIACVVIELHVPTESLAGMSHEAVNQLPYGLIRLDEEDRVIEYNSTESALSGRSREGVLHRSFFREVAPCTNVREIAGWFSESRAAGEARRTTLRFVFAFDSGRQYVRLSLAYDGPGGPSHLLVQPLRTEHDG